MTIMLHSHFNNILSVYMQCFGQIHLTSELPTEVLFPASLTLQSLFKNCQDLKVIFFKKRKLKIKNQGKKYLDFSL